MIIGIDSTNLLAERGKCLTCVFHPLHLGGKSLGWIYNFVNPTLLTITINANKASWLSSTTWPSVHQIVDPWDVYVHAMAWGPLPEVCDKCRGHRNSLLHCLFQLGYSRVPRDPYSMMKLYEFISMYPSFILYTQHIHQTLVDTQWSPFKNQGIEGNTPKSMDTLSPIIMEVENGCIWKVSTLGGTHFSHPWLREQG